MTKTPGGSPGSSSLPIPAYARPGVALAVAALAYGVAVALSWPGVRLSIAGAPPWVNTLVATALLLGPLLVGAVIAGRWGGPVVAEALGIRVDGIRFRPLDLVLGALIALESRVVMEVVSPTTGSLLPAFADSGADTAAAVVVSVVVLVVLAPLVEELFFRGAVLRSLDAALARTAPHWLAATIAVALSTLAFVVLHAVPYGAQVPLNVVLPPLLIGVGAGALAVITGRIAAGLIAHVLFNLSGVVLLLV